MELSNFSLWALLQSKLKTRLQKWTLFWSEGPRGSSKLQKKYRFFISARKHYKRVVVMVKIEAGIMGCCWNPLIKLQVCLCVSLAVWRWKPLIRQTKSVQVCVHKFVGVCVGVGRGRGGWVGGVGESGGWMECISLCLWRGGSPLSTMQKM